MEQVKGFVTLLAAFFGGIEVCFASICGTYKLAQDFGQQHLVNFYAAKSVFWQVGVDGMFFVSGVALLVWGVLNFQE